jgi:hypothetical protein
MSWMSWPWRGSWRGRCRTLSRSAARWRLALLLAASAALYVVPFWWGLPSLRGWAPDEIVPTEVTAPWRWPSKYPPLHRYLLVALDRGLAGTPEEIPPEALAGPLFLANRLVSTGMALLAIWLVYRLVRVAADRTTALWAAALTAPALPLVFYAKTANLDVPYFFWFLLSALFFLRALEGARLAAYAALGLTAALAVSTKDQAYGLYAAMPCLLAWDLGRRRRRAGRAPWGALLDGRLWLAAGTAAAALALVWGCARDGELARHLEVLVGVQEGGRYRMFPPTPVGQASQAVESLSQIVAAAGLPNVVAALCGLVIALRRPREHRWALALLATSAAYYLTFLAPIGYTYVRFFLPVVPVVAIFAALCVRRLLDWSRLGRAGWLAAAFLLLGWPLARAVALDLHMLGDARYAAEEWLEASETGQRALGIGDSLYLPRRIETRDWRWLEREPCGRLQAAGRPVLIVNPDEVRGSRERSTLRWLGGGFAGYREERRFANRFPSALFHRPEIAWNLDKIGRDVVVLRPHRGECFDAPGVWSRLRHVREGGTLDDRAGLADAILAGLVETISLRGGRAIAAGLAADGWSRGPRAAAVVVRARPARPTRVRLEVQTPQPPAGEQATLFVEDGRSIVEHRLDAPRSSVELPVVAPGGTELFVVWTDASWTRPGTSRTLGVRLRPERHR